MCQNFINFINCFYIFAKYLLQNKTWFRCKFLIDFSFNVSLTSTLFLRFSIVFPDTISFISLNNLLANWLNFFFFFHYDSLCIILAIMVYCQFCFQRKMKVSIVKDIFIFIIQIWYKPFLFFYFKFISNCNNLTAGFL